MHHTAAPLYSGSRGFHARARPSPAASGQTSVRVCAYVHESLCVLSLLAGCVGAGRQRAMHGQTLV